jgi:hypothetical protein
LDLGEGSCTAPSVKFMRLSFLLFSTARHKRKEGVTSAYACWQAAGTYYFRPEPVISRGPVPLRRPSAPWQGPQKNRESRPCG